MNFLSSDDGVRGYFSVPGYGATTKQSLIEYVAREMHRVVTPIHAAPIDSDDVWWQATSTEKDNFLKMARVAVDAVLKAAGQ